MFTGIVERTGSVAAIRDGSGIRHITIAISPRGDLPTWRPAVLGESISVNGACLTVVEAMPAGAEATVSFDVVPETLAKTTLGDLKTGDAVNLERSLAVGDAFGGHYVTGHVDGVGVVRARRQEGGQALFEIGLEPPLMRHLLPKGSVAVDGISLTVVDVDRGRGVFTFAAIPHTLERTNLASRARGSRINVETDAFGKWVLHAMEDVLGAASSGSGGVDAAGERIRLLLERAGFSKGGA